MAARRRLLAGALTGAALLLLGAWLFAASRVDVEQLRAEHDERVFEALSSDRPSLIGWQKEGLRFHAGPPPCAVYGERVDVSDEEVASIGEELTAAGLLGRLAGLSTVLWRWGDEAEKQRHGRVSDNELLFAWNAEATTFEWMFALTASDRLVASLRRGIQAAEGEQSQRADEQLASLTPVARAELRAVWERHPLALSFPALPSVFGRLRQPASPRVGP